MNQGCKSLIVCGYEKIGKSYFYKHFYNSIVLDVDYRNFKYKKVSIEELNKEEKDNKVSLKSLVYIRDKEYPNNYLKYIQQFRNKADILLMNTNKKIIKALIRHNKHFLLVYPEYNEQNINYYFDVLHIRNDEEKQLKFKEKFKKNIEELDKIAESDPYEVYKIKNINKEHLYDILSEKYNYLYNESTKVNISELERLR